MKLFFKKNTQTISGDEIWPSEKWFEIVQTDLQENIMVSLKQLNLKNRVPQIWRRSAEPDPEAARHNQQVLPTN